MWIAVIVLSKSFCGGSRAIVLFPNYCGFARLVCGVDTVTTKSELELQVEIEPRTLAHLKLRSFHTLPYTTPPFSLTP